VAALLEGRPTQAILFKMPDKPADMLKRDLKAAGIPYRDASGRVADFHALRHTFITRLARSGVAPAVAKSLARHSTITLTMDHYTHTLMEDERSALDRLPALAPNGQEREVARATGTDDASPERQSAPPARSAFAARRCPGTAAPGNTWQDGVLGSATGGRDVNGARDATWHDLAIPNNGGAEGIRTPDLLIANQPLSQLSYGPTAMPNCTTFAPQFKPVVPHGPRPPFCLVSPRPR